MKAYLTSYELPMLQSLSSGGTTYVLTLKVKKFFGLVTKTVKQNYVVPEHSSIKSYTDNWDRLIETQEQLH